MRRLVLAVALMAGCGSEPADTCERWEYDTRPPAAEEGASCTPRIRGQECVSADGLTRVCAFNCAGAVEAASGCEPDEEMGCGVDSWTGANVCWFRCPMANPPCL
jgi:hypothetical protein